MPTPQSSESPAKSIGEISKKRYKEDQAKKIKKAEKIT
jgi:hypothetical protein